MGITGWNNPSVKCAKKRECTGRFGRTSTFFVRNKSLKIMPVEENPYGWNFSIGKCAESMMC